MTLMEEDPLLAVADYGHHHQQHYEEQQRHQRRYQSLPDGYNPRNAHNGGRGGGGDNSDEMIYRLRQFSTSPKGALIKHGDQIRSKSSAGSTANTSR